MAIPTDSQTIQSIVTLSAPQIALLATAVGAVIAAFISALFLLLNTLIVKKAENKKVLNGLILKYAMQMHDKHLEIAGNGGILPPDAYIVHMAAVVRYLLDNKVTINNVVPLLDSIDAIVVKSNAHIQATREYSKRRKATPA